MSITVAMRTQVSQLYVSLFGRAPDGEGLGYWVGQLAGGKTVAQVAQDMFNVTAARAYYPSFMTNDEIVAAFYVNVLGRTADAEGQAYWVGKMNATGATKGSVIADMINAVVNYTGTDAAGVKSKALFANKVEVAQYYGEKNGTVAGATAALAGVTEVAATVTAGKAAVDAGANPGQTFMLTADVDAIPGTTAALGDDTIAASETTLTVLDEINGGAGSDTLKYVGIGAFDFSTGGDVDPDTVTVTGVEALTLRSADDLTFDASGFTGLTSATATQIVGNLDLTVGDDASATVSGVTGATVVTGSDTSNITINGASGTTIDTNGGAAVVISNAKDDVTVTGGVNVNVSTSATGAAIAVSDVTGTITVTNSKQASNIDIDAGTAVTVTSTATNDDAGAIVIGANEAASGNVSVTQNLISDGSVAMEGSAIEITGGETVAVTINATSTAADEVSDEDITIGDITIIGDGATNTVSVTQNDIATSSTVAAIAEVGGSTALTFKAMASGDTTIVNGLTFTATKSLTAAQAAAAFTNLTLGDLQSAGGTTANGYYTGAFNELNYTSGAATGSTVVFTASTFDEGDLESTDGSKDPTIATAYADGEDAIAAVTSANTIAYGNVAVDDVADASITTINLNGFGDAALGQNEALSALTSLTLANSTGDVALAAGTELELTVNGFDGALDNTSDDIETLNVTMGGSDSSIEMTADGVVEMTVVGNGDLDLTGSTFTALETLTVSGAASVILDGIDDEVLTSIDASGTSGGVEAAVDAASTEVLGGSGVDLITLNSVSIENDIDLGAGDDTLDLSDGAVGIVATDITATVTGGAGTADILIMDAADAEAASANTDFDELATAFEVLQLVNAAGGVAVDLDNLTYSTVIVVGVEDDGDGEDEDFALDNMTNNGMVKIGGDVGLIADLDTLTVTLAENTATDSLNITFTAASEAIIVVNSVETIVLSSSVKTADSVLELSADSVTSVSVTGAADLELTTDSTVLTTVNATSMTGALTYTTDSNAAVTVTGGSGGDDLTATGDNDVLNGGTGADTLTVESGADLVQLYGGDGNDTFVIDGASTNLNSLSVIKDLASGDNIIVTGGTAFKQSAVTLDQDGNPNLVSYADAAIAAIGEEEMAWFQYNNNTYIVLEAGGGDDGETFINGEDVIVKITGLVNLSTASYSQDGNILQIA
jgi:S-layer protein